MRAPSATYRLQLSAAFPLAAARALLPYLDRLGVTDLYLSPILQARAGSTHGYDVTDPTRIRDELGGEEQLALLARSARERGMGIVLDIVPNHMAASVENPWWKDVLRHGPASRYASYFDIDWEPARAGLADKVMLPVLERPYAEALEAGDLRLVLGADGIELDYRGLRLPLSPRTQASVLGHGLGRLVRTEGAGSRPALELAAIVDRLAAVGAQAPDETHTIVDRLSELMRSSEAVRSLVEENLGRWNGRPDNVRSFDLMDRLLDAQSYRVAYWRVADQEINYRRFFDVNDLVALRVEDERVFEERLGTILRLAHEGAVTGLRIDHVDGLHDPARFLARLRERVGRQLYVIVEKILAHTEELDASWPVQGTTGYDVLGLLGDLFVDSDGLARLGELRIRLGAPPASYADEVYDAKRLVITDLFGGELRNLAQRLGRLAEQHRNGRDLTLTELGRALVGVTASLAVYRTYVSDLRVAPRDRAIVEAAVADAARRDAHAARAIAFMRRVLLLDVPPRLNTAQRALWLRFVMRWQQLASATMAKGHEDTASYRHARLVSRNEVGVDPTAPIPTVEDVHARLRARAEQWPLSLSATATHDTKRGEDTRTRISVLSEVPELFAERLAGWVRFCEGRVPPAYNGRLDADTALLLFQTLVGAWPLHPSTADPFADRVAAYALKAVREAKRRTSWRRPDSAYERTVEAYARAIVEADERDPDRREHAEFAARIAFFGAVSSLGQVALKIAAPGIPDVYQGCELWDLSLVDPDNRRPVDVERRRAALDEIDRESSVDRAALANRLLDGWSDGRVKLLVTALGLRLRRARRALFETGRYVPLPAAGDHRAHVFAFARASSGEWVIAVAPRLVATLVGATASSLPPARPPLGPLWGTTSLALPPGAPRRWRDELTGIERTAKGGALALTDVLATFPVALLVGEPSDDAQEIRSA
ncbi:MAG TPA: malto-oligosyltrehalose synthase [Candidatus Limnocylindria bacterium]|nr:malto-oligosyltrehalose synthase [Candidatus Limnocylindria bacterium]